MTSSPADARRLDEDPIAHRSSIASSRARFSSIRSWTERLCDTLAVEDYVVQSMPDASPTKWHLAHTTWFFETFVLRTHAPDHEAFDPSFDHLFNSYYETIGDRVPRAQRGLLTRPSVAQVFAYRRAVDEAVLQLLDGLESRATEGRRAARTMELIELVELGLQHEQQHQELLLTDIKHAFSCNPLLPSFAEGVATQTELAAPPLRFVDFAEGLYWLGHTGDGFAFDNERPRHRNFVHAFALGSRLVTNAEYLSFIADGGYRRPELWLSDGWATVNREGWTSPMYWERRDDAWWHFTLHGPRALVAAEPVVHVSYYEADAFARWFGARLPSEAEWEVVATSSIRDANSLGLDGRMLLCPQAAAEPATTSVTQLFGDAWEWTKSAYDAYPGYVPPHGAIGEYNAKFMCNQFVLRGGSSLTPPGHIRATYRNFFPAHTRWQMTGIRLAQDR